MEGKEKKQPAVLGTMLLAFALALFIKMFLFDLMITQGRSMLPAIKPGSVLVVHKAAFGIRIPVAGKYLLRWGKPGKGDMVVFWTPFGERAVKRCSGVDGEGNFYALGDNDLESFDSRSYGTISFENILGKVIAVK